MSGIKKKKNIKATEVKTIAPNNMLYIILLLVAVALTGISLSIRKHEAVFTIWTSITCGGIASILVAWLIDAANCRKANKKTLEDREALFANLYHTFDSGLQLFILESAKNNPCTDSKEWFEWIDDANKQVINDPALIPEFIQSLMFFFDDIAEQVFAVKSQEAALLEPGIICQEDIQALSTILSICDTSRATFRSKENDNKCFQQFITNCRLIRKIIDFAPSLRSINNMMIDPMLYRMYLESEEKPPIFEENQDNPVSKQKKIEHET